MQGSVFGNVRKYFSFEKILKKLSFEEIYFFNLRARKFHFPKYKEFFWMDFFCFLRLGLASAPGSSYLYYLSVVSLVQCNLFIEMKS